MSDNTVLSGLRYRIFPLANNSFLVASFTTPDDAILGDSTQPNTFTFFTAMRNSIANTKPGYFAALLDACSRNLVAQQVARIT